jgi:hypothetical protein
MRIFSVVRSGSSFSQRSDPDPKLFGSAKLISTVKTHCDAQTVEAAINWTNGAAEQSTGHVLVILFHFCPIPVPLY